VQAPRDARTGPRLYYRSDYLTDAGVAVSYLTFE